MRKLKLKVAWLFGLAMAKLKKLSIIEKMARRIRLRYPVIWGAVVKRLRPFYRAYQTSMLDNFDDVSFKYAAAFNEQQWQKKLLRQRAYNSYLISSGVMNNRPIVDPVVILERIDRDTACRNH